MTRALLLVANGACVAMVLLLPLAGPLGLADVEVPGSAFAGAALVGVPAALTVLVLVGLQRAPLWRAAFFGDALLVVVAGVGLVRAPFDGRTEMLPVLAALLLLFAADLWWLYSVAPRGWKGRTRG